MATRLLFAASIVILLLIWPAVSDSQTQTDLNIQSAEEFRLADAKLNDVYKALMAKMNDAEAKKKLVAAEKAWISFRDAECETEADDYRGGSIQPLIRNGCNRDLTVARAKQLQDRLDELNRH